MALTLKRLLPIGFIIFAVIGVITLGWATPTEAAATGTVATFIITLVFKCFNWRVLKATLRGSVEIWVMVFAIIATSSTFSMVLAYTGASKGLVGLVENLHVHPMLILISMQFIVAFMGCFMDSVAMMMICMPVFMPISNALGFDPVWFGILFLINVEMGQMTPPFGMLLFVMKGVAPKDITMEQIIWAAIPYILFDLLIMALIMVWPGIALWLPRLVGL
jgi:tripartite ATP-independent transporter DctM subunit